MNDPLQPFPNDIEEFLDRDLPWKSVSPEEYAASKWLDYQVFSSERWDIKNQDLKNWVLRFDEILHDLELLHECRRTHLTDEEFESQEKIIRKL